MVSRAFYDLSDCLLSSGGYKINLIIIVLPGIRWQANNNNNNHIVVFVCIEVCLSTVQILEGFPFKNIYIYFCFLVDFMLSHFAILKEFWGFKFL
jgi:hypothetical protein